MHLKLDFANAVVVVFSVHSSILKILETKSNYGLEANEF